MSLPLVSSRVIFKHGVNTLYDLTNVAESFDIQTTLNDVGTYVVTLPMLSGISTYKYMGIALNDDIFIYLTDNGTLPANPNFGGKITKIAGAAQNSVLRTFYCKDYAEVLEHRYKTKYYGSIAANTVATEVATECGLGTGSIGTETGVITENFDGISYKELLARISDYWVTGSTMIQKDWKVDYLKNLVWTNRPMSTALGRTVETVTYGSNMANPIVYRDIESIKNYINVYGNQSRTEPDGAVNSDAWTETADHWDLIQGYTLATDTDHVKGSYSIKAQTQSLSPPVTLDFKYYPQVNVYCGERKDGFNNIHFKIKCTDNTPALIYFSVICTHETFYTGINGLPEFTMGEWSEFNLPVGPNTTSWWIPTVDSNMWNEPVIALEWKSQVFSGGTATLTTQIDDLYFGNGHFKSPVTSNTASINAYGQRELVQVDDKLLSDAECLNRQSSVLLQQKDPVIRINFVTPLNLNIQTGDRLTLTLPFENITSQPFDVVQVHHTIKSKQGALTNVSATSVVNTRKLPPVTVLEALNSKFTRIALLNRGVQQASSGP